MKAMIQSAVAQVKRLIRFIHHELWEVELSTVPPPRRYLLRFLRTAHLVIRGIKHDNIPLHASALTLGTLISIVPILAITFSMYKGLGAGDEDVVGMVTEWMEDMPEEFQAFILQMLEQYAQVNVAAMGGIFLALVLFIVIKMLAGIEEAFNRVWYISDSRNMLRRISNYISVLVIVPILVVTASAASAIVDGFFREQLQSVAWVYRNLIRLGPLVAVWLAFTFLYMFVPNTRVRMGPGFISGLVGAFMWLVWQWIYIEFQIGISKHNAIYGTFASIPIFLGWLYISWIIVLLGAEVAFALQNSETYKLERTASDASMQARIMVALGIVQRAAEALEGGKPAFEVDAYAREQTVSIRLVNDVVRTFERASLLGALADQPGSYTLLKAPDVLRVKDVVAVLLQDGASPEVLGIGQLNDTIQRVLTTFNADLNRSIEQITVKELVA